jgi:hypothetical protein
VECGSSTEQIIVTANLEESVSTAEQNQEEPYFAIAQNQPSKLGVRNILFTYSLYYIT